MSFLTYQTTTISVSAEVLVLSLEDSCPFLSWLEELRFNSCMHWFLSSLFRHSRIIGLESKGKSSTKSLTISWHTFGSLISANTAPKIKSSQNRNTKDWLLWSLHAGCISVFPLSVWCKYLKHLLTGYMSREGNEGYKAKHFSQLPIGSLTLVQQLGTLGNGVQNMDIEIKV